MSNNIASALPAAVLTALAVLIGACGSGYGDAAEPALTAAPPTRTSGPAPVATSTVAVAPAPATELTLVASSVRFEQTSLTAPAGAVTIVFDNRDAGVSHNVHVFRGTDASGEDVGSTEIEAGRVRQTLILGELAPGTYFYQCDVHPSQMSGTLTIT